MASFHSRFNPKQGVRGMRASRWAANRAANISRKRVREELGVGATAHEVMGVQEFDYAHGVHVEITFVRCTLDSHEFAPSDAVHAARWALPQDIDTNQVLEADRVFMRGLGAP